MTIFNVILFNYIYIYQLRYIQSSRKLPAIQTRWFKEKVSLSLVTFNWLNKVKTLHLRTWIALLKFHYCLLSSKLSKGNLNFCFHASETKATKDLVCHTQRMKLSESSTICDHYWHYPFSYHKMKLGLWKQYLTYICYI